MTSLQNLWNDLVDRRLWPVALALVVLLVALPVLFLRPAPEEPAPALAPAAAGTTPPGTEVIADVSGTAYAGPVTGATKDPFKPQRLPAAIGGAGGAGGGAAGGGVQPGGGGTGGGGTGGGGTGGGGVPQPPAESTSPDNPIPTPPLPGAEPDVVASLQFGLAGGEAIEREVAELTPLPSATSPAIVYLGQTRQKEAAFLVSSDVTPSGAGRCLPSPEVCSTLYLRPGQITFLKVATSAGQPLVYRLKFLRAIG